MLPLGLPYIKTKPFKIARNQLLCFWDGSLLLHIREMCVLSQYWTWIINTTLYWRINIAFVLILVRIFLLFTIFDDGTLELTELLFIIHILHFTFIFKNTNTNSCFASIQSLTWCSGFQEKTSSNRLHSNT